MSNGNKSDKESHQMPKKEASRSDHSIYSLLSNISISQDENFRMPKYAENSLRVMETYLKNQELTDIVLIAGTFLPTNFHFFFHFKLVNFIY